MCACVCGLTWFLDDQMAVIDGHCTRLLHCEVWKGRQSLPIDGDEEIDLLEVRSSSGSDAQHLRGLFKNILKGRGKRGERAEETVATRDTSQRDTFSTTHMKG